MSANTDWIIALSILLIWALIIEIRNWFRRVVDTSSQEFAKFVEFVFTAAMAVFLTVVFGLVSRIWLLPPSPPAD